MGLTIEKRLKRFGSNLGAVKIFPILVQYFDKNIGIKHNLIKLKSLPNETSETICNLLI